MYCFCKNQYYTEYNGDYTFSDGQQHCQDWLKYYSATQGLTYGVPLLIALANFLSKTALSKMSEFERRATISEQKYSTTINVAAISFLNLGVMVLLVNLKI